MVVLRACAKINLHLRVGQRDPATGYHALETLFQTVGLYDTLRAERAPDVRLVGRLARAPRDDSNLIVRATHALQQATGYTRGARIHLVKRIPVAAGLGGGSTDAAAALVALNRLWRTRVPPARLRRIAARLGADVPFLLDGGSALGTGRGERLTRLSPPPRPWWVLLITSADGVDTGGAFTALNRHEKSLDITTGSRRISSELRAIGKAWSRGDCPQPTVNTFERSRFRARPRLGTLVKALSRAGAVAAHLSGSGPTVYGLFQSRQAAREAEKGLRLRRDERAYVVPIVPRSPVSGGQKS